MKPGGLQPIHKVIVFMAVILVATVLWFATASPMTPSEHLALQVRKAFTTNDLHAYNLVRVDQTSSWIITLFDKTGMWTVQIPDKAWPKFGYLWYARVEKTGNVFTVNQAVLCLVRWDENETHPHYRPIRPITIESAQMFLNEVLHAKPNNPAAQLGNDYGLFNGPIDSFWKYIRNIIDRPEYNKKPDKTKPKVEMSI